MKNKLAVLAALVVGFGCGTLVNCDNNQKKSITLKVIPGFNKPIPIIDPGDTIEWFNPDSSDLYVDFLAKTPCQGNEKHVHTCVVSVSDGMYPYECAGCEDPTIPIGRSTIYRHKRSAAAAPGSPVTTPSASALSCESGNAQVTPVIKGLTGQYFVFSPSGNDVKNWTVTLPDVPSKTCEEGDSFQGPDPQRCTIAAPLTSDITYNVVINDCSNNKNAQGKIVHR